MQSDMAPKRTTAILRLSSCRSQPLRVQVVLIYDFLYPKWTQSPIIGSTWTLREEVSKDLLLMSDVDALVGLFSPGGLLTSGSHSSFS